MDHKTWLWKKRSSQKTIIANDKADIPVKENEKEIFLNEKIVALENSLKNLNEKLASVLCECNAKDEVVASHEKRAQEAIAGQEKAETKAVFLKQELDEALQQKATSNERLTHLNAALKDCMQQLRSVREEQEQRMHDAVMKTSREFEKAHKKLEEKLTETSKRLASVTVENSRLSKALLVTEKLVEDLSKRKSQAEAEFNTLMARLDSTEKENAFLKYEFCMLEKELEIRNEEIEFSRRSVDASHKQHLESVKKITKLEAECQRLRVLVRKRLPGPAALAKMKSEVEIQGKNQIEMRRRKLNPITGGLVVKDFTIENPPEIPSRKISFLIERLCDVEEENKILKEILAKKEDELHSSRATCAQTASKLSQIEPQLGELSKFQKSMELAICNPVSNQLSLTSGFDIGSDDTTCSGSWASALISEQEHFKHGEPKNISECKTNRVSDMSLMDDFVEMEKLAIVSVDVPLGSSYVSSEVSHTSLNSSTKDSCVHHLDSAGKELVPVVQGDSSDMEQELQTVDVSFGKPCDWLHDVVKIVSEENRVSKRSLDELLEDIRVAFHYINCPSAGDAHRAGSSKHPEPFKPLPISSYISWRSPNTSPRVGSINGIPDIGIPVEETNNERAQSNLRRSICKIIELIRSIDPNWKGFNTPDNWSERDQSALKSKQSTKPVDYLVQVFRWERCELNTILQQFVHACNDLLDGKVNFEKFAGELASVLCWIVDNCVTFQDVSSVKDNIEKHSGRDGSQSVSELGYKFNGPFSESANIHMSKKQLSCLSFVKTLDGQNFWFGMEEILSNLQEENKRLKDELNHVKSLQEDLEVRLQIANNKSEVLGNQLGESEQSIGSLQTELETLKESKSMIEDHMENQKLINEDLDTQLTVAKVRLNEVLQKLSSLEVELEDKSHCCEELEATCLELQLQLESLSCKEIPKDSIDQEQKLLQTGWEITAASAKLAECQETILNLGKQLKALASPNEGALFDGVFSTTSTAAVKSKKLSQRSSLRDRMLAEDGAETDDMKSPKTEEVIGTEERERPTILHSHNCSTLCVPNVQETPPDSYLGSKHEIKAATIGPLAIVQSKKRGGGSSLLRKLLLRRKRGSSRKTSLSFVV